MDVPHYGTPPVAEARRNVKPGVTVADLRKQGIAALNDAQLKALIVDKSLWVENTVSGTKSKIIYSAFGNAGSGKSLTPSDAG